MNYKTKIGTWSFFTGRSIQTTHCVGLSELGLASDFTIGASEEAPIEVGYPIYLKWAKYIGKTGILMEIAAYQEVSEYGQ